MPTHLNETGREQARYLAEFFKGREFAAAYASDLPRAYETADIIMAGRGVEVVRKPGLRERCLGKYEGLLSEELHAARTAIGLEQSGDLADWAGMPGVESNADIWQRGRNAMREISDSHAGKDALVVCHGGMMAQMVCGVLGISGNTPRRFPMSNGLVIILQWRVDAFYMLSFLDVPLVVGGRSTVDTSATKSA